MMPWEKRALFGLRDHRLERRDRRDDVAGLDSCGSRVNAAEASWMEARRDR